MKLGHWILDDEHNVVACDMMEWVKWFDNDPQKKVVKQTTLDDGRWVSTVFLGLDHNYSDDGPPILFETMIFPGESKAELIEEFCERYATWDEALAGHEAACLRPPETNDED